jgi:hypothetical protein
VDNFKEMRLPGYVEKAVVIKPNGTQVKADIAGGEVVFKTLEENDISLHKNPRTIYRGRLFLASLLSDVLF